MKSFKLLNCHPKKTRKNNSCYDSSTILKLKELWNQNNYEKINSTNPRAIWDELKIKIKECSNELCWLDKLVPETDKKKESRKKILYQMPQWQNGKNTIIG